MTAATEIWFQSAGTPLFAVEQGHGLPLVILHGGLADHRATLYRFGSLAAAHRLIAPDVRGAGRSHFAGELSWDLLADDIRALLDHLQIEKALVGGTSAGSAAAIRFALRYPQRVSALLALWPVYAGQDVGLNPTQQHAMDRMNEAGQQALAHGIEALLPLFSALPPQMREAVVAMARQYDPASVAATTRFLASGAQPIATLAELGQLSMPTLIVPGVDPEHPADVAGRYAAVISAAVLTEPSASLAPLVDSFAQRLVTGAST